MHLSLRRYWPYQVHGSGLQPYLSRSSGTPKISLFCDTVIIYRIGEKVKQIGIYRAVALARERPKLPLTRELSAKLTEGEKKQK